MKAERADEISSSYSGCRIQATTSSRPQLLEKMEKRMRFPTTIALGFVLGIAIAGIGSSAQAAKSVYVVGPQPGTGIDFTTIQAAVEVANSGDVILVKTGTYDGFFVNNKALTIQADRGEMVTIESRGSNGVEIANLDPDSTFVLRRMTIDTQAAFPLLISGCAGPIWIEDCLVIARPSELFATLPKPAVYSHESKSTLLSRSTVLGSGATLGPTGKVIEAGAGIAAYESNIHLYQTTVFGGPANSILGKIHSGGAGVAISGGLMFAGRCSLHGGKGWMSSGNPQTQCIGTLGAGTALWLQDLDPEVNLLDTELESDSGAFGQCGGLPTTPHKIDSGTITVLPGFSRLIKVDSIVKASTPVSVSFEGKPGDLAVIAYSTESVAFFASMAKGTVFVKPPYPIIILGKIPNTGKLPIDVNVPALPPGFDAMRLYFQGAFYSGEGIPFVTNPSAVTIVK